MAKVNIAHIGVDLIATADYVGNTEYIHAIGNKSDGANNTADQSSIIGLLRYLESTLSTTSVLGVLNTAAHTGVVDDVTTVMGYIKQLLTDSIAIQGAGWTDENLTTIDGLIDDIIVDIGDPSGHILTDITAKIGNIARSLDLVLGSRWDTSGDLGSDITSIIAALGITGVISGTSDSGTAGTLVDATLTQSDDYFNGMILIMTSGDNIGLSRTIIDFDAGSDTISIEPDFDNAIGTDSYTILPRAEFADILLGNNNNNNVADTALIVSNADGSVLERLEYLQTLLPDLGDASSATLGSIYGILGNPGTDALVEVIGQLADATLSKNADDSGAETVITLLRSIVDRVGKTGTSDIYTDIGLILSDLGDPSSRGNLQSIETMLGNPDAAGKSIYSNIGDFVGQTNLQSLLEVIGWPDVSGKNMYTVLVTDRLDDGTFGLSQLRTQIDANETKIDIIDGYHDVPGADSANNNQLKEVIGNKTDTIAGDSLMAIIKQIVADTDELQTDWANGGRLDLIIDGIQADLGDPSSRTNLQTIEAMLGNPDTAGNTVWSNIRTIHTTAIDGSNIPVANTLSDILHKDGSYTFDNTTDSLESIGEDTDTIIATNGSNDSSGTHSYLDAGGEQDVVEIINTTRKLIESVWVDAINLTNNGTFKVYYKVDGTNYRELVANATTITAGTDEAINLIDGSLGITEDFKISYTELADEGVARDIPYSIVYQTKE